jgi:autophagy-related protein 2
LSLRLTVPANFFQQSIIAEVDGIEVHVAADIPDEHHDDADDAKVPDHRKTTRRIYSPPATLHDSRLPSASSLARSILLEEPVEEKQELEARYMAKSSVSETSDDLGTGTSLGLPAMVASFLQGIVDRVQVRIKDVNVRISLHDSALGTSPIIFIAHLANIQVNAAASYAADTDRNPQVPAGKRRQIALEGLSVHFVREERFTHTRTSVADLFASYTSSATGRKEEQKSDTFSKPEPALAESDVLPHMNFPAHAYLSDSDDDSLPDEMTQSTASFDIRPGEDNVSWADRRSRGSSDRDQIWSSFAPEDDRPASEILQDLSSSVFMSTIDTRASASVMSQSTIGQSFTSAQAPQTASSSRFMHQNDYPSPDSPEAEDVADSVDAGSAQAPSPVDPDNALDLTESVVYSHAEAESMYMSAVGPEPGQVSRSSPKLRMLPGGWNSVIDDDEDSDPPFLSQVLDQQTGYESEDRAPTPTPRNQSPVVERQSEVEPQIMPLTYISKEILAINKLSIGIRQAPRASKPVQKVEDSISQSSMTTSAFQQAPGAFSIYAEGGRSSVRFNAPATDEEARVSEEDDTMDTTIEVQATPITLQLDAGTIRSLITLAEVAKSPGPTPVSSRSSDQKDQGVEHSLPGLSLQLETFCVSLFEDLPEVSVELTDLSAWRPEPYPAHEKRALLQFELQRIDLEINSHPPPAEVGLKIGNLIFTAGSNDILSFDTTQQQTDKRSIRHAIAVTSVTRTTIQGQSVRRIEADLLPLRVDLDLVKFDEDFDTLGGMMGIVEMSSSLLSSGYFAKKPEASAPLRRGVRFQESPADVSAALETKFGARLEGFDVRLASKSCFLELQASTTKIVHRQAGVKVAIEALSLTMPTTNTLNRRSTLDIFVKMIQLVYKPTPLQQDLSHLISLVTPSKNKYENDDDILVDTLIRQRRKGSVLNVHVSSFQTFVHEWEFIPHLQSLGDELSKLSAVTKYLPEDDTPGILFLVKLADTQIRLPVNDQFGLMNVSLMNIQVAHVGLPALTALSVGDIHLSSIGGHDIIHEMLPGACKEEYPMLMLRMVGDEVEPAVKVKLFNICVEYDVPTLLSLTSTETASEVERVVQDLAASALDIQSLGLNKSSAPVPDVNKSSGSANKKIAIDVLLQDCALGLQPTELESKGLFVLQDTKFVTAVPPDESFEAVLNIRQASLYVVDHETMLPPGDSASPTSSSQPNHSLRLQTHLLDNGYVSVSSIRSAQATVCVLEDGPDHERFIDVELRDEFFLLETCADSTQTLFSVLGGLSPPALANDDPKFRPQLDHGLMTLDDMVNSFSGDAFIKPGPAPSALFDAETDLPLLEEESLMVDSDTASGMYEAMNEGMGFEDGDFYSGGNLDDTAESLLEQDPFEMTSSPQFGDDALLRSLRKELGSADIATSAVIRPYYQDDRKLDKIYGGSRALGEAHEQQKRFPVQVRVREVNIIWNLYDGYDWRRTREAITQAVEEVEMKLEERKSSRRRSNTFEDDAETVIGDCLFNSIYIGVPSAREPADLRHSISNLINQGNEAASETESYATTGISRPSQADLSRQKRLRKKRLRLQRGTSHKLGFELKGVSLDFLIHPAGSGEVQSSIDVRVTNFEIFDHVPTSTWKKFLTLHNDRKNMREMMKPMIHLELLNVRPVPELVATEMTIRVSRLASFTVPKADHVLGFCSAATPACRPRCTRVHDPLLRLQRRLIQACRCICRATVHTTARNQHRQSVPRLQAEKGRLCRFARWPHV